MDLLIAAESQRTSSAYLAGSVSSPIVDYVTWSQWVWPYICLASRHVFVYVLVRLIFIHISLKAAKNVQWLVNSRCGQSYGLSLSENFL